MFKYLQQQVWCLKVEAAREKILVRVLKRKLQLPPVVEQSAPLIWTYHGGGGFFFCKKVINSFEKFFSLCCVFCLAALGDCGALCF